DARFFGGAGAAGAGAGVGAGLPSPSRRNSSSRRTGIPSAWARPSLEPASSPATRKSVLAVTLPPTVPPSRRISSSARARVNPASRPVTTTTFPASGSAPAGSRAGSISAPDELDQPEEGHLGAGLQRHLLIDLGELAVV